MYPVLGMRGGYSLDLDHDDNTLLLVGWGRGEGGDVATSHPPRPAAGTKK